MALPGEQPTLSSGGAAYDLELYVTVDNAPASRRASITQSGRRSTPPLAGRTATSSNSCATHDARTLPSLPQVDVILASQLQRLSWKSRGMAYATTLKNVGAVSDDVPGGDGDGPRAVRARR